MTPGIGRRLTAEFLGTSLLLTAIVGSGIMGERLSGGNTAIALLANSILTGTAIAALILTLQAISGAHFNPAVTLLSALRGETKWGDVVPYSLAQATGALLGVLCAHTMFSLARYSLSHHVRSGAPQFFSEGIATLGLLLVIAGCSRFRSPATPYAVAAYITGAYWFTSSTSFANPAATLARSLTDTIPSPGFVRRTFPAFCLANSPDWP